METAGTIAVGLLVVIAVFQAALAAGAPLAQASWGGQHRGVLPMRLRVASGIAAVLVYPVIILLVVASSGLVDADRFPLTGEKTMWVLTGVFVVGALTNAVSRSRAERFWAPVSLAIAFCCAVIAASQ